MECEQRGLLEYELVLLQRLEGAVGDYSNKMCFGAASQRIALLAKTKDVDPFDDRGHDIAFDESDDTTMKGV